MTGSESPLASSVRGEDSCLSKTDDSLQSHLRELRSPLVAMDGKNDRLKQTPPESKPNQNFTPLFTSCGRWSRRFILFLPFRFRHKSSGRVKTLGSLPLVHVAVSTHFHPPGVKPAKVSLFSLQNPNAKTLFILY